MKNDSEQQIQRARRMAAVREATAGARLQGETIDPEVQAIAQRYIDGEIDSQQMSRLIMERAKRLCA